MYINCENEKIDNYKDLFKKIFDELSECTIGDFPIDINVQSPTNYGHYKAMQRGTFKKNGIDYPSIHISSLSVLKGLKNDGLDDTYMVCINPESNNYKFYRLTPTNRGIECTYGRIGAKPGEMYGEKKVNVPYKPEDFWCLFYEKLSKGYQDKSDIYLGKKVVKETKLSTDNPKGFLLNFLGSLSKTYVSEKLVNSSVTKQQIEEAEKKIKKLYEVVRTSTFNKYLMELMSISPRKCSNVNDFLAKDNTDYSNIIAREENLLAAMKGTCQINYGGDFGNIHIWKATEKQEKDVLSRISDSIKPGKKISVYRVINDTQKTKFEAYLKKNNITKVKRFWHGSRNENWMSILTGKLLLNPNAVITGKMLGNGIYFAPDFLKSWNYTSFRGTSWASGNSNTAVMGLYSTAYGKPYDVTNPQRFTQADMKRLGTNCVHAHGGSYLRADEICFYDEDAVNLDYIVVFEK